MTGHPDLLPQLADDVFLTDGGLETSLLDGGLALPEFAAFVLLAHEAGREALRSYYAPYLALAREAGCGFVLDTPTWRASADWGDRLGHSARQLAEANRAAVALVQGLQDEAGTVTVISGCIGPRADEYDPATAMTAREAARYHAAQVATLADAGVDLVTATTMADSDEAVGIVLAAHRYEVPAVVSFTVSADGLLPSGEPVGEALATVDDATQGGPAAYQLNCARPAHAEATLRSGGAWTARVRGLRANGVPPGGHGAGEAWAPGEGEPADLGARYADLRTSLPQLTVLGGCCGTDLRHLRAVRDACLSGTQGSP